MQHASWRNMWHNIHHISRNGVGQLNSVRICAPLPHLIKNFELLAHIHNVDQGSWISNDRYCGVCRSRPVVYCAREPWCITRDFLGSRTWSHLPCNLNSSVIISVMLKNSAYHQQIFFSCIPSLHDADFSDTLKQHRPFSWPYVAEWYANTSHGGVLLPVKHVNTSNRVPCIYTATKRVYQKDQCTNDTIHLSMYCPTR